MSQIAKKPYLFDFGVGETGGEVELVLAGYFVDGGLVLGHFDLLAEVLRFVIVFTHLCDASLVSADF